MNWLKDFAVDVLANLKKYPVCKELNHLLEKPEKVVQ